MKPNWICKRLGHDHQDAHVATYPGSMVFHCPERQKAYAPVFPTVIPLATALLLKSPCIHCFPKSPVALQWKKQRARRRAAA